MTTVTPNAELAIHHDLVQGTEEWYAARAGLITASTAGKLLTPTLRVADNDTSRGLTMSLAAERITGHVDPTFTTFDMERGHLDEPQARALYAEHHDVVVDEVGFMVRPLGVGRVGYSPDGLVGDDGLLEIKSRNQRAQVGILLADEVPAAHMAQLQCGLLVSGRAWIDYVSYSSGMPMWTKRVRPQEEWAHALHAAAEQLEERVAAITITYRAAAAGLPVAPRIDHYADMEI